MAGEKTEKATPKKRRDARKEGTVLKSQEVNNSVTIICAVLVLSLFWRTMFQTLQEFFVNLITNGYEVYGSLNSDSLMELSKFAAKVFFTVCGPLILLIMVSGVISNYMQVGFLFIPKSIMPKADRISLLSGLKRLFSANTVLNFVKTLLKIGICAAVAYLSLRPLIEETVHTINGDINQIIEFGASNMISIAFRLILLMVTVAVIDYIFQWFENEKKLKMSKQEVKDEYKNTEGNPEIKSRVRNIQTQLAMSRMMQQIPNADVVIANPTHYAIVLKYDREKSSAPVVIAKGADNIALKIKEIAKLNGIEIVESKEVARALYKSTNIGEQIPPEFFNAVAEILAYIYSLKQQVLRH